MKITKQQLRRIIQEEQARVLRESNPNLPPSIPLRPGGVESMLGQKMANLDPLVDSFDRDFMKLAEAIIELEYGGYGGIIDALLAKA